jgi:predicted dienelactone hydrolase
MKRWALSLWVLAGCGVALPDGSVDAPDELGPFDVGHTSFVAIDAAREERRLLVDVWYPVDPGDGNGAEPTSYPLAAGIGLDSEVALEEPPVSGLLGQTLLVFSHGYGGINTQSVELMEALASHGFVVAAPEHTGNAQASFTDGFDAAAAHRVPDVSFVIDTMIARNQDVDDGFHQRLDEDAVGVVGHSFGGMTALGVAAGWAGADADPRVAAIVPISAVVDGDLQSDERGGDSAGFSAAQLATVTVPVMLLGGTADVNVPVENNQLAFDDLESAPVVYKVDVLGATHTHFASVCPIGELLIEAGIEQDAWALIGAEALLGPYAEACSEGALPIEEATRLTNLYTVAFLRRHLLGEEGFDAYLTERFAETEPLVELSVR